MHIVTAANRGYFGALINLVGSIHHWNPDSQIIIYDLGVGQRLADEADRWNNVTVKREFLNTNIPEHCRQLRQYAWKPYAMCDAIQTHEHILWIDAGSDVRAPLNVIEELLYQDGHFFAQGQDVDMTGKSLDRTYKLLGQDKRDFVGKPHYAGNLQGYSRGRSAAAKILEPLKQAAGVAECIAPSGANLSNHRFDQTLLSILIYASDIKIEHHTDLITASRHELSFDPFLHSDRVIFTARRSNKDYMYCVRDREKRLIYNHLKKYNNQST